MFEINGLRYERVKRDDAFALLEQAHIAPDKLTAHRDKTFTARYSKDRMTDFATLLYEARMEAIDNRVAIFKRPSPALDKGRYVTLQFAVASTQQLGINGYSHAHDEGEGGQAALLSQLQGTTRDMHHLIDYAHDLAITSSAHPHLTIALEELAREVSKLADGLKQLNR